MKSIMLAVWLTLVMVVIINRVAENDTIECDGVYLMGKMVNTLIWCGFLFWFGG